LEAEVGMIRIEIPDFGPVEISHLVLDYNGTLAVDGILREGAAAALNRLAERIAVHVLTADTFGVARSQLENVRCQLTIIPQDRQEAAKLAHVETLGAATCFCIGNGRNDRKMLKAARIGIAVIQTEGASGETLAAADIVCTHILDALALLENPKRLIATLRS